MKPGTCEPIECCGTADGTSANADDANVPGRDFLAELGRRVRHMRSLRSMSRKALAQVSGISERYLAQLEGGAGNFSIILLRRVAEATGIAIEDLVADAPRSEDWPQIRELLRHAAPTTVDKVKQYLAAQDGTETLPKCAPVMVTRVALIGLRAAGKTTLGRIAADRLGWSFTELHQEIESATNLSIGEIFKLYGQEGYRRLETKTLSSVIARPGPMIVVASGGIVSDPVTFDLLLTSFFTVWVRARPEEHIDRIRERGDPRRMADCDHTAIAELANVLSSREPLYARARVTLDTSGKTIAASANELVGVIEHYCDSLCPWVVQGRMN